MARSMIDGETRIPMAGTVVRRLLGWVVHQLRLQTLLSLTLLLVALRYVALGLAWGWQKGG